MNYMTVHFTENGARTNFFQYLDQARHWQYECTHDYGYTCGIYVLLSNHTYDLLSIVEGDD